MQFDSNIPEGLLSFNYSEADISILVGENGSGKSTLLGKLTDEYLNRKKKVIAIANTVHDKFPESSSSTRLHLLRDRMGRRKAKYSVKQALINIPSDEITRLKNASQSLNLVGYDPVIGIENISINPIAFDNAIFQTNINNTQFEVNNVEEIRSLLFKLISFSNVPIIWLSFLDYSFEEIDKVTFIQLLKYESVLKKLELTTGINIFLRKKGEKVPYMKQVLVN